jgi:hypothetical protein
MSVGQSTTPIKIDDLNVQITHANIHGSNAVGTLVETLADLFTNGRFSQDITSRINQDISLKGRLAQAIQSAIDRVLPAKVATKIEQLPKIPTKFPVIFRRLPNIYGTKLAFPLLLSNTMDEQTQIHHHNQKRNLV